MNLAHLNTLRIQAEPKMRAAIVDGSLRTFKHGPLYLASLIQSPKSQLCLLNNFLSGQLGDAVEQIKYPEDGSIPTSSIRQFIGQVLFPVSELIQTETFPLEKVVAAD